MSHYWNPTNYNNRDDLVVPVELSDPQFFPEHTYDKVDKMFQKVQGGYPHEINPKKRWFRNESDYTEERLNDTAYFFR